MRTKTVIIGVVAALGLLMGLAAFSAAASISSDGFLDDVARGSSNSDRSQLADGSEPVMDQTREKSQDGECIGDGEPVMEQEQTREQTQDGECTGDGEPVMAQEQTREQSQDGECTGDGEPVKTQEQTREQTQDGECTGDGEHVRPR